MFYDWKSVRGEVRSPSGALGSQNGYRSSADKMGGPGQSPELIARMRHQCLGKGISGIKGLAVLFRGMDKDYSKSVNFLEFTEGVKQYGLIFTDAELELIFKHCDKDKSTTIDFREFLEELRPPMPKCRVDVINQAFDKMDVVRDNLLKVDDLKIVYRKHAEKHPKFKSGQWTLEEVLTNFLDTFDSPDDKDGVVTRDEFMNYYAGVSCTIDDNSYFDLMMRSCWGLPPKRTH